jgi:hypothetical protein
MPGVSMWCHGHVHDSFDYQVGGCRVVANPAGYIKNLRQLNSVRDAVFENNLFNPECVLEIPIKEGPDHGKDK